jgi:hypothetical protein
MKKTKIIAFLLLASALAANAQITKGNWMVGGSGDFTTNKSSNGGTSNIVNLSPNIGYFVIDKLSFGTLFNYNLSNSKYKDSKIKSETMSAGPFVRYYLLNPEKSTNIFLDSSYYFSLKKEDKSTSFSTKIGASFFLNSSVALETSLKYTRRNSKYYNAILPDSYTDGFTLGIGVQIHLEKY